MSKPVGQDIDSKIRTIDVEIDRNVSFEQLMLSPAIIAGEFQVSMGCLPFFHPNLFDVNFLLLHVISRIKTQQFYLSIADSIKGDSFGTLRQGFVYPSEIRNR